MFHYIRKTVYVITSVEMKAIMLLLAYQIAVSKIIGRLFFTDRVLTLVNNTSSFFTFGLVYDARFYNPVILDPNRNILFDASYVHWDQWNIVEVSRHAVISCNINGTYRESGE